MSVKLHGRAAVPAESSDDTAWPAGAARAMHPSNGRLEADVIASIAAGLAAVTIPWEMRTGEVPDERRYERILATEAYEAWVIFWPAGGSLALHDHGESAGAFSVVAGHLDEATVDGAVTTVRRHGVGAAVSFGIGYLHAVANQAGTPATSVHVYSPPLSSMSYFDRDDEGDLIVVGHDPGDWADGQ
jgi:Cysteine dioxygenase type I